MNTELHAQQLLRLDPADKSHHSRAKTCGVEGCDKNVVARGMCGAHYNKWRTLGDPLAGKNRASNGTGYVDKSGYRRMSVGGNEKPEHVLIAESALGRPLPNGAVVHHADRNRLNNANSNLVICPYSAYHNLIHKRLRAFEATGDPNALKCCRCGKYDQRSNLRISGRQAYHLECNARHVAKMTSKRKEISE